MTQEEMAAYNKAWDADNHDRLMVYAEVVPLLRERPDLCRKVADYLLLPYKLEGRVS